MALSDNAEPTHPDVAPINADFIGVLKRIAATIELQTGDANSIGLF
jgi:hypothetical protein